MEFRLLGPVELELAGSPVTGLRRHERMLLAVLLLEPGRVVSMGRLIRYLWDGSPPERATRVLHTYVSRLRRALAAGDPAPVLDSRGGGYVITVDPDSVDAHRYQKLVDHALTIADPAQRAEILREADGLWRGRPLSDLTGESTRAALTGRLEALHQTAVKEQFTAELALGHHQEVAAALADVTEKSPHDEVLVGLLMLALHRSGRRVEALEVYRHTRERLAADLGLDPGDDLRRLHQTMLQGGTIGPGVHQSEPTQGGQGTVPQLLPARVADFVGRDSELARIRKLAGRESRSVAVIAIAGLPGVGKTCLAIQAAHELRNRFPGPALHLDLGGELRPVSAAEALARILRALGIPGTQIPSDLSERAGLLRAALSGRACVLVLDNAVRAAQVTPLIPSDHAVVLVTSRRSLVDLDGAHHLHLREMEVTEAVTLLGNVIGYRRTSEDPAAAAALVAHCGGLPLAVRIAAARLLTRPDLSLRNAARQLAVTTRLDHLSRADRSVRGAFDSMYASLPARTRCLLRRLALPDVIDSPAWMSAVVLGEDSAAYDEALADLVEANLLEVHGPDSAGQYRYRMHDLVRTFAYERALAEETSDARKEVLHRTLVGWLTLAEGADADLNFPYRPSREVAAAVTRKMPDGAREIAEPHGWFRAEMPNLQRLIAQARRTPDLLPFAWALAWNCEYFLRIDGRFDDVRTLCVDGLAAAQDADDAHGAACMHLCLAFVHTSRADVTAAMHHIEQADMAAATTTDQWLRAEINVVLADIHNMVGDLEAEQSARERAVTLFNAVSDFVSAGTNLTQLGWVSALRGDPAATECARRGVTLLRDGGAGRPLAVGLWRLGQVHALLGRHEQARVVHQEALELARRHRDRVGELCLHAQLSISLTAAGDMAQASRHLTAATTLAEVLGLPAYQVHVQRASAHLQRARGDLLAAKQSLMACLDSPAENMLRLAARADLGSICRDLGEHETALEHYKTALRTAIQLGVSVYADRIRSELASHRAFD